MTKLVEFLFKIIDKIKDKYILIHRKRYWKRRIKSCMNNKMKISKDDFQKVKYFFKPYTKVEKLFCDFYYEKTGIYSEKFIPHDIYYNVIDPYYNNWKEAKYLDNKCYYEKMFPNIKQPVTIAKRINNLWYLNDDKLASYQEVLKKISLYKEYFLKKAVESEGGSGVFYLKSLNEFKEKIKTIKCDLIIQEPIKQSEIINKLSASSVNTIRVLSLLNSREVKIYSSVIRMGIKGSKTDNASSGGIICGIEINGNLKDIAFDLRGNKYLCHPETGLKFNEIKIPNYDKILEKVKEIAINIPHFRLVSWDIALDFNNEPVLIEANLCYGGLDFHQLNNGPLFKDDTEMILEEVFQTKRSKK